MKARLWWFAAAFSLFVTVPGCKKDKGYTPPTPAPTVTITASATSVVADGSNTVTLTLTNTAGGSVTVTTTRGTFATGGTSVATTQASATIVLVTCNATTDTTCAGPAVVTATGAQTGSVTITFGALADMCEADCSVDLDCGGLACIGTTGAGTCSSTNPSSCVVSSGGGGGGGGGTGGPAIAVTPDRARLPAIASTTTTVVVEVTNDGQPVSGASVALSTTLGTLSPISGTTGADGKLTVTFTSSGGTGVATITATTTATTTIPVLTGTATITIPRLGSIQLPAKAAQYAVQGVKGSGWNELGWLQVQVLDEAGEPYPDGLTVRFEHRPLGGSTLSEPHVTTGSCATWSGCVRYDATTTSGTGAADSAGLATAWLYSGTVAGTLEVAVSTAAGGVTRSILMPTVAVVGAKANGANFSVVCSPRNVPALAETNCSTSLVDAPFTCMALLKDRYGNVLGRSTQVIFASEASAVGPVTTTPSYDPTKDAASQTELGSVLQMFATLGAGLPFDVPIQGVEPYVSHGLDGCGTRTHNPRDGVVTIIAVADGEEAFFDGNGNGVYDRGTDTVGLSTSEPFIDQGEPFVDIDDNGQWEAGEWFLDVDGNRAYTVRNGVWDGDTKIWTQTVVVYTGAPASIAIAGTPITYLGTRWATDASFTSACSATPEPADFSLKVAQAGPPAVPGESATYHVVASDMNLNYLHTGTTYATAVATGTVTVKYWGLPSYADDLGFFYRYWPCDQAAPPVCASQCRSTKDLPCVMKPTLGGFWCGAEAEAVVTAGSTPSAAGAERVDFTVTTPYDRFELGKKVIAVESVSGNCVP